MSVHPYQIFAYKQRKETQYDWKFPTFVNFNVVDNTKFVRFSVL